MQNIYAHYHRLCSALQNTKFLCIDSASSFNENLSQSKLSSLSQSSFDSNQSLIGSTTNCEHSNDLDNYFASRFGATAESDIEILSNPSISSIEVLDRFSRQSSRKQSEDFRNLLQTQLYVQQHQRQFNKSNDGSSDSPSLEIIGKSTSNSDIEEILDESEPEMQHIEDVIITEADRTVDDNADGGIVNELLLKPNKRQILTGMNLTESSSSGSVTDGSICTTVENRIAEAKTSDLQTLTTNKLLTLMTPAEQRSTDSIEDDLDSTVKMKEASTISNMLEGNFEIAFILMH